MIIDLPEPTDYQVLTEAEQEVLCQEILAEVSTRQFKPAGEHSREHWNEAWSNQDAVPYFMRPAQFLRVNGQFVRPFDEWLELRWYQRFRRMLGRRYLQEVATLYEFGCGNGWNLAASQEFYLGKRLVGLDWADSGVQHLPAGIEGRVFDFFHPDYDLKLDAGCGIWTVGALEQTGTGWEPFLEYLLTNRPDICVHVEPMLEWYDPKNPVDATAIEYHLARNYWRGFSMKIGELARQGKAKILEQKRSYFGSKYIEGYSVFCWRPV